VSDRELYCATCEGVVLFEAPPCVDDHGADCPELSCTGCGSAVLIATFAFRPARANRRPRTTPRAPRHAARPTPLIEGQPRADEHRSPRPPPGWRGGWAHPHPGHHP
jgi:hypothetical protein